MKALSKHVIWMACIQENDWSKIVVSVYSNLVIIVFADVLAPKGARLSAGSVLITKLGMISLKFLLLLMDF